MFDLTQTVKLTNINPRAEMHGEDPRPAFDLKIEAQNGGSVVICFRIIAHPESEDVGKLCEFIQRDIDLDLLPPAPQTVGELFGEAA